MPDVSTGSWLAHFRIFFEGYEYEYFIFLALLGEIVSDARKYLDTGIPLRKARAQFLVDVTQSTGRIH